MRDHAVGGAVRADLLATALVTAAVLGAGMWLGVRLRGSPHEEPTPPPGALRATPPPEATAPLLQSRSDADAAEARIAKLEASVEELRRTVAAAMERARPALEAFERASSRQAPADDGSPAGLPPGLAMESDDGTAVGDARELARTLGLDANRREGLATRFAQTLTEIEALETSHAEVARDGAITTIKIGKYGPEASGAIQGWRDWIDRSLTPQEKERYEREQGESRLLGMRAGLFDRTVRIDEAGGLIQFKETIATKDGPMDVLQGTAPAAARHLVLAPYAHLLPTPDR